MTDDQETFSEAIHINEVQLLLADWGKRAGTSGAKWI